MEVKKKKKKKTRNAGSGPVTVHRGLEERKAGSERCRSLTVASLVAQAYDPSSYGEAEGQHSYTTSAASRQML